MEILMTFTDNYDTFESDQQRLDELKAVEAELGRRRPRAAAPWLLATGKHDVYLTSQKSISLRNQL